MNRFNIFFIYIIFTVSLFPIFSFAVTGIENGKGRLSALSSSTTVTTSSITVMDKYSLWTGGTHLRGANIWQHRDYEGYYYDQFNGKIIGPEYTQNDFDTLAAMGANYVNISHPGLFPPDPDLLHPPNNFDSVTQDNLDTLLEMIGKANMFAVISFRTGPGRSEFTFVREEVGSFFDDNDLDESVWDDQLKQDAWAAMWLYTANRYKNSSIVVAYDLMVEPNSEVIRSREDPVDFYNEYKDTLSDWNNFFPALINAIRSVDKNTPIMVGGQGYSSIEWLEYIDSVTDSKTILTFHQYEPYYYTHQYSNLTYPGNIDAEWVDNDWLVTYLGQADRQDHPLAVNEYGVMRYAPGADLYQRDSMNIFEQHGWNHALWNFHPASFSEDDSDFHFLLGSDPDNFVEVSNSDLIEVIEDNWTKNTLFPSTVRFRKKIVLTWLMLLLQ